MSMLADKIEKLILERMRQEQERVTLRRNELAEELDCAPSQISYVLSTRFSNDRGFNVESRRGLGGYILITRLHDPSSDALPIVRPHRIYESPGYAERLISMNDVNQSLFQLLQSQRISNREAQMMHNAFRALMAHVTPEEHNEAVRELYAAMLDVLKED